MQCQAPTAVIFQSLGVTGPKFYLALCKIVIVSISTTGIIMGIMVIFGGGSKEEPAKQKKLEEGLFKNCQI